MGARANFFGVSDIATARVASISRVAALLRPFVDVDIVEAEMRGCSTLATYAVGLRQPPTRRSPSGLPIAASPRPMGAIANINGAGGAAIAM
jgi:hypothetical protein